MRVGKPGLKRRSQQHLNSNRDDRDADDDQSRDRAVHGEIEKRPEHHERRGQREVVH